MDLNVLLSLSNRPPFRQREYTSATSVVVAFLLLIAGVKKNPGPRNGSSTPVQFGLLNSRSAVRKAAAIHDAIADHKLDVVALTESWMRPDDPDAITQDVAPAGYNVLHAFRTPDGQRSSPRRRRSADVPVLAQGKAAVD